MFESAWRLLLWLFQLPEGQNVGLTYPDIRAALHADVFEQNEGTVKLGYFLVEVSLSKVEFADLLHFQKLLVLVLQAEIKGH